MELSQKNLPDENSETEQLEKEISELEIIANQKRRELLSTLGRGCFPMILIWICCLGVWLLPHPIPMGYLVPLNIIGLLGVILIIRFVTIERKRSDPAQNKKNMDMLAQLEEKRKGLRP